VEFSRLEQVARDCHHRLNNATLTLSNMREAVQSSSAAAGANTHNPALGMLTREVWAAMRQERWQVEPIGPLGESVTIQPAHEQWIPALQENLTRKHMSSYVVDNFQDQQKLQTLLARIWKQRNPQSPQPVVILLRKGPRYDVRRPNVPFALVLDKLHITNDWVYNAIITMCKPERWALHEQFAAAEAAIRPFRAGAAGNDYVSGSLLLDGGKVSIKGGSVTSERASERVKLFHASQADKLREQQEQLRELEASVVEHQAAYAEAQKALQASKHQTNGSAAALSRVKEHHRRACVQLAQVKGRLQQLEDEAEEQRLRLEKQDDSHLHQSNQDATNEMREYEAEIERIKSEEDARISSRIQAVEAEQRTLEEEYRAVEREQSQHLKALSDYLHRWSKEEGKLQHYTQQERLLVEQLRGVDQQFADVCAQLERCEKEATELAPVRVDTMVSCKQLMAELNAKENLLQEKRRTNAIDLGQVQLELKETQLERARTEGTMARVMLNLTDIQASNKQRIEKMKAYRRIYSRDASHIFNELLSKTGGSGRLDFDIQKHTLNLVVNPNVLDAERDDAADTAVLSGGERSTTTIAFVMAVGEQVDCPIRAIDEFDVFMDPVNRRKALDILLGIGQLRRDRQFLFLSPLDVTDIRPTPFLTLHRLKAPQRNQTTLDDHVGREERKEQTE